MEKHKPIYDKLTSAEQYDLASITKHPGMNVLMNRIGRGHLQAQLMQIMEVQVDDAERIVKLAAISGTAAAMKLFLDLLESEMGYNFKLIEDREAKNSREAERNAGR